MKLQIIIKKFTLPRYFYFTSILHPNIYPTIDPSIRSNILTKQIFSSHSRFVKLLTNDRKININESSIDIDETNILPKTRHCQIFATIGTRKRNDKRLVNSSMQYSFVRTILPLKRMTNLREVLGLGSVFRAESRIVLSNQPAQRDPHSFPRAIDRGILRFRGRFPPPDPI